MLKAKATGNSINHSCQECLLMPNLAKPVATTSKASVCKQYKP